ncbi:hypothetical protein AVHY2522_03140 [Acidovorax sp. SUPP2522]|uniref:hypothetical protein n=1 Tax=unclassified Acidovorax TaxID=2684926 RepID=UPI00234A2E40|nr:MULTISPECIES: hypothetical protein [unclassified Acidovorax]WCM98462.1 hypothetical protein M5C96_03085 [Acidovorax sp. GBBC 1281]GKT14034.1 hypothetical protein AVHY2522_03140 [Acidovorax sp. SUPP2522]
MASFDGMMGCPTSTPEALQESTGGSGVAAMQALVGTSSANPGWQAQVPLAVAVLLGGQDNVDCFQMGAQ